MQSIDVPGMYFCTRGKGRVFSVENHRQQPLQSLLATWQTRFRAFNALLWTPSFRKPGNQKTGNLGDFF